jgi:hypothetical protein
VKPPGAYEYPGQLRDIYTVRAEPVDDIITKFTYEPEYQQIESVSHPMYTDSPFAGAKENVKRSGTLIRYRYKKNRKLIDSIGYPDCTRDGVTEVTGINETFPAYTARGGGRLTTSTGPARISGSIITRPGPGTTRKPLKKAICSATSLILVALIWRPSTRSTKPE